jgi:two-component system, cell cycle sensor histidine kinase and response regulator CckA
MTPDGESDRDALQALLDGLRAENAAFREREERQRRIVTASTDYIYSVRLEAGQAVETRHGHGCLALTGYTCAELETNPDLWLQMVVPEDRPFVEARARRLNAGEDCPSIEHRILRQDGTVRWVSNTAVIHRSADGRALAYDGLVRDVTERRNAEEALRASEARLKAIFKAAPTGIGVVIDRRLVEVNDRLCEMVGRAASDLLGQSARILYPSDEDFDFVGREKYRQIAERGTGSVETRFRRQDGTIRDVLLSSTPLDPANLRLGVTFTALDITERKAAEQALRQEHGLLLRIADTSPVAVTVLDREGRITFCNAEAEAILGVRRDEATLRSYDAPEWRISDLEGRPFPEEELPFHRVMKTRQAVWGVRHAIESAEGRRAILSVNAAPLTSTSGEVEAVVATLEDITERLAAEHALQESERRAANLIEASPMGVHMYDLHADGRLVFVGANPAADRLLGVDNSQFVGKSIEEAFPPLRDTEVPERYRRAAAHGETWITQQIDYRDGQIAGAFEAYAFQTKPGSMAAFFLDITPRLRAEQENAKLQAQFLQAQKMEVIGRLAGGVAHDFNNLLTAFVGYSEFALQILEPDHPARAHLQEIRRAADRATALTRQLLAFARKRGSEPRVIDLNALIEQSQRMASRIIGEDVDLRFEPGPGLWPVRADPNQVDQIVLNLATNARDAMPGGGRLTLATANVPARSEADPDTVRLSVRDTGIGMAEDVHSRATEPFFTTKERGTGLGLSTVREIAERHGARLEIETWPGQGTCVSVSFPRAGEAEVRAAAAGRTQGPSHGGTETILVVEDDPAVRNVVRECLEARGYTVLEAGNGPEAFGIAATTPGEIALLLSDIVLPGINGWRIYEALRESRPALKQLFISGYAGEALAWHGVREKGLRLLHKPFTIEALTRQVREALDAR